MSFELLTIHCLSDNYAFLAHDPDTKATLLVDAPEPDPILTKLREKKWDLTHVLITHHHWDHVDGLSKLLEYYSPQIIGSSSDINRLPPLHLPVAEDDEIKIGNNVVIKSFSHLESCKVENKVEIGPYARIRPDTILKEGSKVGNFVEIKKSTVGNKSKINHLSYVGDSNIGKMVNVGAGTITCNYDGVKKSKTIIKDKVFIGSNSSLVAPVKIDKESIVGAGSVITKNVKKKSLALTRSVQVEIKNYKRKTK